MLGQIESYPRMMINGLTLPPFIHSRCSLGDGINQTCSSKRVHQCLPKTLSICASLVQLFYSKTPESSDFVWKAIYAEQDRLYQEGKNTDYEGILEALQATCIYVILQTLDPDSQERNNVRLMINTLGAIGERLHDLFNYAEDVRTLSGRDMRYKWMTTESARRTVCLLYIIETLLEVLIGKRDRLGCRGFSETPLPCGGSLWETASTLEWAQSYHQMHSVRRLGRPLMVADLGSSFASVGSDANNNDGNEDLVADVMSWCGSLDQFGTIVWMAGTMVKTTTY
ncbi:hypothetical protein B0T10DRAFT_602235 [Thelonectria olida]|uniref:Uncharacterized protein n=1 Tax=Thelonectria olida TaxID=1576542 RepID=A0A9P8WH70_9HYPO|nr:hypothetical protein B0T10DRAFT_602235 [Thelonectria olida]